MNETRRHSPRRWTAIAVVLAATYLPAEIVYFCDSTGNVGEVDSATMASRAIGSLTMQGFTISQCLGPRLTPSAAIDSSRNPGPWCSRSESRSARVYVPFGRSKRYSVTLRRYITRFAINRSQVRVLPPAPITSKD